MKFFPFIYSLICMIGWGLIYLISPNIFNFAWRKELQSLFLFSYSIMLTTTLALLTVLLLEYILVGPEKSSLKRIFRPDASMLRDQICWILAATGLNSNIGFFLTLGLNFFLGDYFRAAKLSCSGLLMCKDCFGCV